MKIAKNRSEHAHCIHCGEYVPYGEVSISLGTIYYYHGCHTFYLHMKCIESFIKELSGIKKKNALKILNWKLIGDGKKNH